MRTIGTVYRLLSELRWRKRGANHRDAHGPVPRGGILLTLPPQVASLLPMRCARSPADTLLARSRFLAAPSGLCCIGVFLRCLGLQAAFAAPAPRFPTAYATLPLSAVGRLFCSCCFASFLLSYSLFGFEHIRIPFGDHPLTLERYRED